MVDIGKSIGDKVDYYEHPGHSAERALKDKGYVPIPIGREMRPAGLEILKYREPVRYFFRLFEKHQPAYHAGNLIFATTSDEYKPDKKWLLNVFGDEFVDELSKIVEELARKHNVQVEVRLGSTQPKFEER